MKKPSFISLYLIIVFFRVTECSTKTVWQCTKIKLAVSRAKLSVTAPKYGHYLGSCLREKSEGGVHIMCEQETFCGVGLKSHRQVANNFSQSDLREDETCDIYITINNDVSDGENGQNSFDCDVIERQMMDMWGDVNDCVGVYCNSTPHEKCVDRLGYYECVDSRGQVRAVHERGQQWFQG